MPDIKILVIGSQNVGKSSFVEKFSDEVDKISGTGGLETVRNKRLILGENTYKLMLLVSDISLLYVHVSIYTKTLFV